jgi:exportin-T
MIQLAYYEVLNRYWHFFELNKQYIPQTLESFIDIRGLHNPQKSVRSRAFYLFLRFIKNLRPVIGPYVPTVLVNVQDLLLVEKPDMNMDTTQLKDQARLFDSQLYLFEAVGMMISHESFEQLKQVEYLEVIHLIYHLFKVVTSPMLLSIQQVFDQGLYKMDVPPDRMFYTKYLHDLIMALGAIARGFPDYDTFKSMSHCRPVFSKLLQGIIVILENMNERDLIRDAVPLIIHFINSRYDLHSKEWLVALDPKSLCSWTLSSRPVSSHQDPCEN